MGKREKKKPETSNQETFVPDLTLETKSTSGLDSALEGLDEPVVFSETSQSEDSSISQPELTPTGRVKRKYGSRKKSEEPEIDLLTGEEIQMAVDFIIPMAIAGIHNMANRQKISPDDIMLTTKQEEKMNKLAQRMAERMKMSMNPFLAFGLMSIVAYGGNYIKNKP